ncbi:diacylglycerol kinase family protein [Actinacidiphila yeochonensis]|uniref:diacylglycerol kinase n=1 Tax=Actinacidiphila yeochonensis TaxID=89050 RepID=UPI000A63860B|nr:diacylglycerol kinase [Actinacidiphila yeochonensis]
MSAHVPAEHPLLVVIDPAARAADGESVRIARDVLCAGAASVKIAFPESAAEAEHLLAHRGRRHPVLLGDDAALVRTLQALRREGDPRGSALSVVPIGPRSALARELGVPVQVPAAARAVLDGVQRELGLLRDDSGGIVLGTLSLPYGIPLAHTAAHWWTPVEKTARSLVRTLTAPVAVNGSPPPRRQRLRVEADGVLLADLDEPVHEVSVRPAPGTAEICVRRTPEATQLRTRARTITVSGRDFRYRADSAVTGPVRTRTWTLEPSAWRLTVPR